MRILICKEFGWTLEQFDSTDAYDLYEGLAILEGHKKAQAELKAARR